MFDVLLPPGLIDQDPPHGRGSGPKRVRAIGKIFFADQSQIGLMNQCSRVESVPGRFVDEPGGGQFAKFIIHQRQQSRGRQRFTIPYSIEDPGYFNHPDGIIDDTEEGST